MHLLATTKGALNETGEAIDLGQDSAELLFLSAADTEIAAVAAAATGSNLTVRVANLMQLSHPMSVDLYCENTVAGSRLIVVRLLGGERYWPYGVAKLLETAQQKGCHLVVLPGDDRHDPNLAPFNTLGGDKVDAMWRYLVEGGPLNMRHLLDYCGFVLGGREAPPTAAPFIRAGLVWPGLARADLPTIANQWHQGGATVAICFYRALVQAGNLQPIYALIEALQRHGMNPLPIFLASLKDPISVDMVRELFRAAPPQIVINLTGFAVAAAGVDHVPTVLDENGAVVLQAVLAGASLEAWRGSSLGLGPRDLAMNIALPEIDGRVFTRAIAFKNPQNHDQMVQANIVVHTAEPGRVDFVARQAKAWARLRQLPAAERKVAIVLANYPNRDGRIGNGVGLDTPAGTVVVLNAMDDAGYRIDDIPQSGNTLIERLLAGATNAIGSSDQATNRLTLTNYLEHFKLMPAQLRQAVTERWGKPEADPHFDGAENAFAIAAIWLGNGLCGIQPARGYNIDPKETYHSPDLIPPHSYLAFYIWLKAVAKVDAVVHMGKHGNLEWLPGKALSLDETCWPEAALGAMANIYPFIVNDPGEGTQAKRRTSAVIVDHLTPPLTRAESYGPLADLEALVDEYYDASGMDVRRSLSLKKQILELATDGGLDLDAGIGHSDDEAERLTKLDAYLCDLKEMQIRDGLHVFGCSPQGRLKDDLVVALARVPRGLGAGGDASLQRALAADLGFAGFDPLDCEMAVPWNGPRPAQLADLSPESWRSNGDTVERIELLASRLVSGELEPEPKWSQALAVLHHIDETIRPRVERCGSSEIAGLLAALAGKFLAPGPSGAPTRGRTDVLPTGRNFYSVDNRAVPTPTAWTLGKKSAELLVTRYRQDHGQWPRAMGLTAWGTSNMRTGGDDIAQALALIGAEPNWDHGSRRVSGYEITPLAKLGRPRVDITLRISGFFRDAFPTQITLFDQAVRAIGTLDEEEADNPIAARIAEEARALRKTGLTQEEAEMRAGFRVFGSKPGSYGAGLQALIDERGWDARGDLGEAFIAWGGYGYGANGDGQALHDDFRGRLKTMQAVVQNQDNREHDLLDSDDYYQFEGGMTAAVEAVSGARPAIYHNDHSRPERPVIRTLEEEIARVVRGRAANPKWIAGVMRHGYKGAFEMAATVDYLFAFSATTGAVRDHHFDAVYQAYIGDEAVRKFLAENNPAALGEMAERFLEAQARGLWTPRSNSAKYQLETLISNKLDLD